MRSTRLMRSGSFTETSSRRTYSSRKGGQAKILDFGLAKLSPLAAVHDHRGEDGAQRAPLQDTPTGSIDPARLTSPGVAMGTVAYMSPEQARGEVLDARTDLFSFGAVLYEMTTGKRAFSGNTTAVIFHSILAEEPTPPRRVNPELPPKLEEIVNRLLEKDRDLRYQHAADLRSELKRLKRDTESGRSAETAVSAPSVQVSTGQRSRALLAAGLLVVLAVVGVWLWTTRRKPPPPPRAEYVQLTNFPDSVTQPAVSPDGRMVTFVRGPNTFIDRGQIYVKMLPDGQPVQLTRDDFRKMSPVFSPDGSRIAYTVLGERSTWDTWVVPVLGGAPEPWLPNASGLVWIDPQRLLYSEVKKGQHMAIVTSLESRADSRDVYVPDNETAMAHRSYPSPDGNSVLLVEHDENALWMPCRLVPFDGSSAGRQIGPPGAPCTFASWSPDGRWIYTFLQMPEAASISGARVFLRVNPSSLPQA